MLGLHLVLVTLHGRFTISIEQDKYNWWHCSLDALLGLLGFVTPDRLSSTSGSKITHFHIFRNLAKAIPKIHRATEEDLSNWNISRHSCSSTDDSVQDVCFDLSFSMSTFPLRFSRCFDLGCIRLGWQQPSLDASRESICSHVMMSH